MRFCCCWVVVVVVFWGGAGRGLLFLGCKRLQVLQQCQQSSHLMQSHFHMWLQLMRTGHIMRKGSFKHWDLVLIVVDSLFVCLSQCQPVLLLLFLSRTVLSDTVCLSLNLKFSYWLPLSLSLSLLCCNCIKDRLPERHSCLNLYPCVIKFNQSVSQ